MKIKEKTERADEDQALENENEVINTELYDLEESLKRLGYRVNVYDNGLILAVRLNRMPSTRGVHVDITYVLDLQRAQFGRSVLALKSRVLDVISRNLHETLSDVDLDINLDEFKIRIPLGNVKIPLFVSNKSMKRSAIYPTKTVYVVIDDVRPSFDLSWLTDSRRVVNRETFVPAINSDNRAFLSDLYENVIPEKWDYLKAGITRGWYGALGIIFGIIGLLSLVTAFIYRSSLFVIPLVSAIASSAFGSWLLMDSRKRITSFWNNFNDELTCIASLSDSYRIDQAIANNKTILKAIGDMSFIISPLLISSAESISSGQIERTVLLLSSILDECVFAAPNLIDSHSTSGDTGLDKFLGLFRTLYTLDGNEEAELALIYSDITSHFTSPLTEKRLIAIIGQISCSLFNAGLIDPEARDRVYDVLNDRSLRDTLQAIEEELETPDDIIEEKSIQAISAQTRSWMEGDLPVIVASDTENGGTMSDDQPASEGGSELDSIEDVLAEIRNAGAVEDDRESDPSSKPTSKATIGEGV